MSHYKIGRIYKIIHNQSDVVYVDSTFNSCRNRWQQHKHDYVKYLNGKFYKGKKHGKVAIYPHFKQYGIENFKLILVKEYPVVDKKHLKLYEQLWINRTRCCNENSAFRIKWLYKKQYCKQYYENNKEKEAARKKHYYESNREKMKQYYENNKKKKSEWGKQYRENNKEKMKQYMKQYHENNKKRNKQRVHCPHCNKEMTLGHLNRHIKKQHP